MPEPIATSSKESLKADLREIVRKTVENTLNGLLDDGREFGAVEHLWTLRAAVAPPVARAAVAAPRSRGEPGAALERSSGAGG